jgi:hypothetical protein
MLYARETGILVAMKVWILVVKIDPFAALKVVVGISEDAFVVKSALGII